MEPGGGGRAGLRPLPRRGAVLGVMGRAALRRRAYGESSTWALLCAEMDRRGKMEPGGGAQSLSREHLSRTYFLAQEPVSCQCRFQDRQYGSVASVCGALAKFARLDLRSRFYLLRGCESQPSIEPFEARTAFNEL